MLVEELIRLFLKDAKQNKKPATARQYANRLKPLLNRYEGKEKHFESLSSLELQDYLNDANTFSTGHARAGEPKSPDTQRANAIALQQLQKFAVTHKVIAEPILSEIRKPCGRMRERLPTEEETAAILKIASPEFSLMYRALRQTGARPNELCGFQLVHINQAKRIVELKHHKTEGKTGGVRVIAIGAKFAELIREAVGARTEGFVFLSSRGTPWKPSNLSATYRRYRDKLKLPKDLCLYLARHEHATKLCQQKGINAAADALGHRNIATTRRYVKPDPESLRDNQDLV